MGWSSRRSNLVFKEQRKEKIDAFTQPGVECEEGEMVSVAQPFLPALIHFLWDTRWVFCSKMQRGRPGCLAFWWEGPMF